MIAHNHYIFFVVLIYLLSLLYIGYLGFRKTKTFADYILGSRKLGPIIGALNVGASDMSSWLFMALPGAFYLHGLNQIWMVLGLIFGSYLSWSLIAKRLREYSEIAGNSLTISEFFQNRFEDQNKIINLISSIIIIFFFTIYVASGFVGSAKLFSAIFNISYHNSLIISCIIIVTYAWVGGFLALSWADLFQGLLMLFVLIIAPFLVIYKIHIPPTELFARIKEINPNHLDVFYNFDFLGCLTLFAWGLGYFGQPHIISKYMAINNPQQITLAKRICIGWMSLSMAGASSIGILGIIYFSQKPLAQPETILIVIANEIFHPIFIGIIISAILAATMSTINSQIIICCSSLSQDFYKRFSRRNIADKEMLLVTRFLVVIITIISALISMNENASILSLVGIAWAGLGASIGPVVLFSLFWKRTTKIAAIYGMIVGAISVIVLNKLAIFSYEILPAFLLSCLVIFVVSLLDKKPVPKLVQNQFVALA